MLALRRLTLWIEATKPLTVRVPEGELHLLPGQPVDLPEDRAKKLLEKARGSVRLVSLPSLEVLGMARDPEDSIVAVRIESPLIGELWFVLSDTETFDPGDHLPIYRPAEIQALMAKDYVADTLKVIHRAKVELDGTIIR